MILKIRSWCEELIIAIILCIIIESLIPNGNNRKYAKVVIGIYIIFITINPILEIINYDFNISTNFENSKYEETYSNLDYDMKQVYIIGIEQTMKEDITKMGYKINELEIEFDDSYDNINKVEIEIFKENDDYQKILKLLTENYLIEKENVVIRTK